VKSNNIKKIQKDELNSYILYWQKLKEEEERKKNNIDTIVIIKKGGSDIEADITAPADPNPVAKKPRMKREKRQGGGSWDDFNNYIHASSVLGFGGTTRYEGKTYTPDIVWQSELEFGGHNFGFGGNFDLGEFSPESYSSNYGAMYKYSYGLHVKKFFSGMNARFRPYAKFGVALTDVQTYVQKTSQYGYTYYQDNYDLKFSITAKVGFEFYYLRYLGIKVEAGIGGWSALQVGSVLRIPFR
jgi:hypothetical protein